MFPESDKISDALSCTTRDEENCKDRLFLFLAKRAGTKKIACLSATMVCIGEIIIFANMQGNEKERVHANAPLVNVTAGGK